MTSWRTAFVWDPTGQAFLVAITESIPAVCSLEGTEPRRFTNNCSEEIDIWWVTYGCGAAKGALIKEFGAIPAGTDEYRFAVP